MHALNLHGIKLHREPNDVDIIIYNPTSEQLVILESLKDLDQITNRPYGQEVRVIKLKTEYFGLSSNLDIIIETENKPQGLLLTTFSTKDGIIYIPIQSIENVVKAKSSYKFRVHDDNSTLEYARLKDLKDLIELKNINFNY